MEIPNILLQVAARWDGESKPAVNAASVILPDFQQTDIALSYFFQRKITPQSYPHVLLKQMGKTADRNTGIRCQCFYSVRVNTFIIFQRFKSILYPFVRGRGYIFYPKHADNRLVHSRQ